MTVRKLGLVLTAVLAVAAVGVPAGADPGGGEPGGGRGAPASVAPTAVPAGKTYRVTLLTGDVVTVTGRAAGCPAVTVQPTAKSGALTRHCGPDGHVTVVPSAAAPLIGSVLDPALFDVTTLVRDGYDDARTADLPLIVRSADGNLNRAGEDPLTAAFTGKRALPSITAVAGRTAKAAGPALLTALTTQATARSATGTGPRVWLDRRVRASDLPAVDHERLDTNLRQVSAPRAWAAGHTGKGARVAVLDTGADFTHPDLAARVKDRADFTADGGDAVDHHGHGTHVAATAAGSGAGSGGARRGIAPDADLLVGKVLDDDGSGTASGVIAGMEWAATRADVINLSLGGDEPSDGTDPMSQALDALTAKTGALFVVAAGNAGPADATISAPAAAATALTVGAVDRTDTVAAFSSRGPVITTHAAKPEITAPGVDIVAARAAGTTLGLPVDNRYVTASGTSMATPHVAGAAALLAARHPDWSPTQLKAALVGAADQARTTDAYTVGAGRLDAAAALDGVVTDQAVVNLGRSNRETTLSWTNTGTRPAEITLDAVVTDHHGRSTGAGRLSATRLSLAPGAAGTSTLTVDRSGPPGLYTALVSGRGADGAVLARTPVAFEIEAPTHELTLTTGPLPGIPAEHTWVYVHVVNLDDPAVFRTTISPRPGETTSVKVPAGRYSVMASYASFTGSEADDAAALVGDPDVTVGAATTVSLDPARARRLSATVDGVATEASTVGVTLIQSARRGSEWNDFAFAWGEAARRWNVYLAPNDGAGIGRFRAVASFGLRAQDSFYDILHTFEPGVPADPTHHVTAAEKARLGRIDHRFHRIRTPTAHKRYALSPEGIYIAEGWTNDVPDTRTDYVTPGFLWKDGAFYADGVVTQGAARRIGAGSRQTMTWARQPLRSDWYDDPGTSLSDCTPLPPTRTRGAIVVELVTLTDLHQRFDCLSGWPLPGMTRSLRLYRNGSLVGTSPQNFADFGVPAGAGDFRLAFDVEPGPTVGTPARISSEWTFRSNGPTGTGAEPLPLLSVDYELPLDAANRPVAGRPAVFDVRQAVGVRAQLITSFQLWTSLDDGKTWQPAAVDRTGDGRYRAALPTPVAGQAMSLRVTASGSAGSGIDQTIIAAYRS